MKYFILSILVIIVCVYGQTPYPACNSIPAAEIDYQQMVDLSPFNVYCTNKNIYKCAKSIYLGSQNSYCGSGIVIQNNYTFSYDINVINNTTIETVDCQLGAALNFTVIWSNLISADEASFCVVSCSPNGIDYESVVCLGRSEDDFEDIRAATNTTLSGVSGMYNAQQDCEQPTSCNWFTN